MNKKLIVGAIGVLAMLGIAFTLVPAAQAGMWIWYDVNAYSYSTYELTYVSGSLSNLDEDDTSYMEFHSTHALSYIVINFKLSTSQACNNVRYSINLSRGFGQYTVIYVEGWDYIDSEWDEFESTEGTSIDVDDVNVGTHYVHDAGSKLYGKIRIRFFNGFDVDLTLDHVEYQFYVYNPWISPK